jgi:diaminohydroxyphosphoribosylaminopyrimidine deaminase / 5-amino-6-(5-phosphoribosylamino)uracil reductase
VGVHEKYMAKCLELASKGIRAAMPNPSVGAIIVHQNNIIGSGYTQPFGLAHAEAQAIQSIKDKRHLSESKLYVSLEPCSHYGKTPPCTQLIIDSGIRHVIVGCVDPNPSVNGCGVQHLIDNGVTVEVGTLKEECQQLNKRFFTFQQKKRPYIILKWAQSQDGYIDRDRGKNEKGINWITDERTKELTHSWRAEEMAILVGYKTAMNDNPKLTVRAASGENPTRIVIDKKGELADDLEIFNGEAATIVFTENPSTNYRNAQASIIDFKRLLNEINSFLYEKGILSFIVEGGAKTLSLYLDANIWDESRVLTGNATFGTGLNAPRVPFEPAHNEDHFGDKISYYYNV